MKTKAIILASVLAVSGFSMAAVAATSPEGTANRSEAAQYTSDTAITAKVKTAFLAEKNLKSLDLHVITNNGTVQLSGFVVSSAQIQQAIDVALHVEGVKDVKNNLQLKTSG